MKGEKVDRLAVSTLDFTIPTTRNILEVKGPGWTAYGGVRASTPIATHGGKTLKALSGGEVGGLTSKGRLVEVADVSAVGAKETTVTFLQGEEMTFGGFNVKIDPLGHRLPGRTASAPNIDKALKNMKTGGTSWEMFKDVKGPGKLGGPPGAKPLVASTELLQEGVSVAPIIQSSAVENVVSTVERIKIGSDVATATKLTTGVGAGARMGPVVKMRTPPAKVLWLGAKHKEPGSERVKSPTLRESFGFESPRLEFESEQTRKLKVGPAMSRKTEPKIKNLLDQPQTQEEKLEFDFGQEPAVQLDLGLSQITGQVTMQKTITEPVEPVFIPHFDFGFSGGGTKVPFPKINLKFAGGIGSGRASKTPSKKKGPKAKYTPSFTALELGIKGKKPQEFPAVGSGDQECGESLV